MPYRSRDGYGDGSGYGDGYRELIEIMEVKDEGVNCSGDGYDLSFYISVTVNKGNEKAEEILCRKLYEVAFDFLKTHKELLKKDSG